MMNDKLEVRKRLGVQTKTEETKRFVGGSILLGAGSRAVTWAIVNIWVTDETATINAIQV